VGGGAGVGGEDQGSGLMSRRRNGALRRFLEKLFLGRTTQGRRNARCKEKKKKKVGVGKNLGGGERGWLGKTESKKLYSARVCWCKGPEPGPRSRGLDCTWLARVRRMGGFGGDEEKKSLTLGEGGFACHKCEKATNAK